MSVICYGWGTHKGDVIECPVCGQKYCSLCYPYGCSMVVKFAYPDSDALNFLIAQSSRWWREPRTARPGVYAFEFRCSEEYRNEIHPKLEVRGDPAYGRRVSLKK